MSRAYIIKLGCKGVRGLSPLDWMEKKVWRWSLFKQC